MKTVHMLKSLCNLVKRKTRFYFQSHFIMQLTYLFQQQSKTRSLTGVNNCTYDFTEGKIYETYYPFDCII